jgi:hypothetical protein
MLGQIEQPIDSLAAEGIYDKRRVYKSLNQYAPSAKVLIPPRRNARIWQHANSKAERLKRDENLRYIRKHGRAAWKMIPAIMPAPWQKPPCSAIKPSLVANFPRAGSKLKLTRP